MEKALGEFEDQEDQVAARVAEREEATMAGVDNEDFGDVDPPLTPVSTATTLVPEGDDTSLPPPVDEGDAVDEVGAGEEEGGTVADYMLAFVTTNWETFEGWKI